MDTVRKIIIGIQTIERGMNEKEKNALAIKLSKYGVIAVLNAGLVFTLLIHGYNLSNMRNLHEIHELINEATQSKYPFIEVMRNEENYLIIVLKSKDK